LEAVKLGELSNNSLKERRKKGAKKEFERKKE